MSVPNQTPYNIYTANGLTTVFAYEFYLISASDIQVTINGNEVTSGYTVSGVGNTGGGEVTFLTAPANGATVIFERVTPTYRLTDYQDNGDLLADTVNKDFDRLWMAIQRAFIYLGVALTRPLFGGGPFNANGYRISNLADPVDPQDAVTKKWYQEQNSLSLTRTLRVPKNESLTQLPPAHLRKGKVQAYDAATGDSLPVIPGSIDWQTALNLQSADGLKYIGRCPSIEALRSIEPTKIQQKIDVIEYSPGFGCGGGFFEYDHLDEVSIDDGGSVIVTGGGARWKRVTDQLLPVHFGAKPGNAEDSTEAILRYAAASEGKTVDFRGSYWTISSTLDLTKVARIISDTSGIFKVNPVGFNGDYAITIGNPNLPYREGRANRVVLTGSLYVDALNRDAVLHGVYLKGQWLNLGHIRASGFNGIGIHREAIWDSTFLRLQTELCGNASNFAYYSTGGGDTDNTNHVMSMQVEQSYDKAIYASGIRDVIHNIHCERTYITTTEAGDTTIAGLNYITCRFNLGNTFIGQAIIDASPKAAAPDGTPTVSTVSSIVMTMDFSDVRTISAPRAVITCSFGRSTTYGGVVAGDIIIAEPASKITLESPKLTGTLQVGSEIIVNNPDVATFRPRANSLGVQVNGGVISTLLFNNNYRGNITFNNVTVTNPVGDLRAPAGSGSATSIGALYAPVTFNECTLSTVNGAFGSRAVFKGGRISTVALYSQAAFEFYDINIGAFGFSENRAFITRGVKADVVNSWSYPAHYQWPAGAISERIGKINSGDGVVYVSKDSATINWAPVVSA
ncbi:phage tail fiber protein [Klebsiella grimontii]|uniref:phage tail fiber domain-containing protein n=1 Tax=Klebsiella grimontii TaxID=2058152 RepID=UPI0015E5522A|nr:phage tail fiber protein [Klebsiella grimontii]QLN47532.1 hypothetical protein HV046_10585 [Klebsiella grimontii]